MEEIKSEIQEFYSGRSVFLTGVTGFLGKALLEKLLRSCPTLETVYVLIRPKNGSSVNSRLNDIFQSPIFDTLKASCPDALKKVQGIEGDIGMSELGLQTEQREKICQNVSIVIHSAASIKFNEPLKVAINTNYYGTQRILNLSKDLKQLAALVYISTAYSNSDMSEIKEEIISPKVILKEIETMDDEIVDQLTPMVIENKPNTYTYTKCLAETLLQEQGGALPICIVRPSIIGATWKEPQAGFVDSLSGLTGVMAAVAKGMLISMLCEKDKITDIIPLDVVVNLTIAAAWNTAKNKKDDIQVLNCCSGTLNPITIREVSDLTVNSCREVPLNAVLRHPRLAHTSSCTLNVFSNIFFSFIPFFLLDVASVLTGKKPRLIKVYKRLSTAMSSLNFFHMNEWKFQTDQMVELEMRMSLKDRKLFFWNIQDLNWSQYISDYSKGIKKWIFKEDFKQIPAALSHMNRVYWLQTIIPVLFLVLILNFFVQPSFKFSLPSLV